MSNPSVSSLISAAYNIGYVTVPIIAVISILLAGCIGFGTDPCIQEHDPSISVGWLYHKYDHLDRSWVGSYHCAARDCDMFSSKYVLKTIICIFNIDI